MVNLSHAGASTVSRSSAVVKCVLYSLIEVAICLLRWLIKVVLGENVHNHKLKCIIAYMYLV